MVQQLSNWSVSTEVLHVYIHTWGTTEQELELRGTRAVTDTDGTSELDAKIRIISNLVSASSLSSGNSQVTSADIVSSDEWSLSIDNVVDTAVRMEDRLDIIEGMDGAISTSTTEDACLREGWRESNGVVEGETERLVCLLATFTAIEEVFLDIGQDREQNTACGVVDNVAIGASSLADDGG